MRYPPSPAALPSGLLDDPRMRRAVAGRDFGVVFALAHDAGISYNKIAEACGLKAERVGKMARGTGEITTLAAIERVADGLRIPGRHLGLAPRPWEGDTAPQERRHNGDDPMKRRNVLRGALAAGLAGPGLAALTTTRSDVDAALAADHTTSDLSYWQSTAERYSYGYNGQAPTDVLADLAADFTEMDPLLTQARTVQGRTTLCHVAGQLAGMIAIVLHDLGQHRDAYGWFHTAGRAAQESGDTGLHAWIKAREAMVSCNFGAPGAGAQLAGEARRLAGATPSSAAALAAAVAARAHAAHGDQDEARSAVADAERLMEQLTPQQSADTWFGYPEQKHHVHLSQALTLLGETERAYKAQDQALRLSRSSSLMTRALITIDRATCLAHDQQPDEAARIAAQAFGELPAAYRTGLTRRRAVALHNTLQGRPEANQLRDALAMPAA
ncbi:hypothetical protein ACFV2X_47975 [Streptomyces sp. NPDC059679]|uniref:hypothetical protein n=1 Tax=Streptomyces sp. NPDC059679 TaxID=3346903 RepID=UPI0036C34030